MTLFRFHRSTIDESRRTIVEVASLDALRAIIEAEADDCARAPIIEIQLDPCGIIDERPGWEGTRAVLVRWHGSSDTVTLAGWTSGPLA